MRQRNAPSVLIYSDSRGLNLADKAKARIGTYAALLARRYRVTSELCPHSHTTIVDFLTYAEERSLDRFDAVVMHCGIVDFSPRPLSNIAKVRAGKVDVPAFDAAFQANAAHYEQPDPTLFEGEPTVSLWSEAFVRSTLIPRLRSIENLIWVTSNPFVPGWEGNYTRGRPVNIAAYVERFDALMASELPNVVDLRDWSHDEVRARTIDNIHFSAPGFSAVADRVAVALDNIVEHSSSRGTPVRGAF